MVEVVRNTVNRIDQRRPAEANQVARKANNSKATPANSGSDSVELKSADVQSSIKQMASAAPVDAANVNRIKDAIKRGEYPIDIDRISEALMEAYIEMKS